MGPEFWLGQLITGALAAGAAWGAVRAQLVGLEAAIAQLRADVAAERARIDQVLLRRN